MGNDTYKYRECGLDNMYLLNGFTVKQTKHGETVTIHDMDGLHRVIGSYLVRERKTLSGPEVRFLRHELGLSQKVLGELLSKSGQTIARWEKGKGNVDGLADRLLRVLYELHTGGSRSVRKLLRQLAEMDNHVDESVQFEETGKGWQLHIAA